MIHLNADATLCSSHLHLHQRLPSWLPTVMEGGPRRLLRHSADDVMRHCLQGHLRRSHLKRRGKDQYLQKCYIIRQFILYVDLLYIGLL